MNQISDDTGDSLWQRHTSAASVAMLPTDMPHGPSGSPAEILLGVQIYGRN